MGVHCSIGAPCKWELATFLVNLNMLEVFVRVNWFQFYSLSI